MLSESERYWVEHLHDAGKGFIAIAQTISQKRTDECEYHLLTEIIDYVKQELQSTETGGMP